MLTRKGQSLLEMCQVRTIVQDYKTLALTVGPTTSFASGSGSIATCGRQDRIWFMLHPGLSCVQIKRAILNVGEDSSGCLQEGFLNALAGLSRGLDKHEAILVGKSFRLFVGNITLRL